VLLVTKTRPIEMFTMNRMFRILLCIIPTLGIFGQSIAAEVDLDNGDRLTGTVVRLDENALRLQTDYAGEICIDWQRVRKLTTDKEEESSSTGISQGGYSTNIVVNEHFVVHIPEHISFEQAAPLLCAGITTYSPLMKFNLKKGDKVGVAGIGGLGHMTIKIAIAKGAEVYAFTTSPSKVDDIRGFGAKEAVVVDDLSKLAPYKGLLDYMICTIPYEYDVAAYTSVVKPFGTFTQVGMPIGFEIILNALALAANRVNFNASLIGGMKETQEVVDYCADHKVHPQIQIISADQINEAWEKVVNKEARYR
jgi:uncharacterized zinc-type alcohol dehydrogenase-like protein